MLQRLDDCLEIWGVSLVELGTLEVSDKRIAAPNATEIIETPIMP